MIPTPEELKQLDAFFFQLVHGDFCADAPDDLRQVLRCSDIVSRLIAQQMPGHESMNFTWLRAACSKEPK